MKDKVSELREILNHKKSMEARKNDNDTSDHPEQSNQRPSATHQSTAGSIGSHEETLHNQSANRECELQDEVATLKAQIEEFKNAASEQKDMFLRQVAEFENMKKRLQKEHEDFRKYAYEKIVEEFFPIIDNLEMTLSHIKDQKDPIIEGVQLTLKQFLAILEKYGVHQISGEGETFDPNFQEAISMQPAANSKSGIVLTVHRKGYKLHDKLLRAAMVTVSS